MPLTGEVNVNAEAGPELKAFIRAEVRKALAEVLREVRAQSTPPRAYFPPKHSELPAWARHEEGTAH